MKITIRKIEKIEPSEFNQTQSIFYWVTVDFFKEIAGRGISAKVTIDIDHEENLKIEEIEEKAIMKAKEFIASAVSN